MPTPVCWYSHWAVTDSRLDPARRPRSHRTLPLNRCCASVRRLPFRVHSSIDRAAMLMKVSDPSCAASKTIVVALWKVLTAVSSLSTNETSYERLDSSAARAFASDSVRLSWRGGRSRAVTVTIRSLLNSPRGPREGAPLLAQADPCPASTAGFTTWILQLGRRIDLVCYDRPRCCRA